MTLLYIIGASLAGGVLSVLLASTVLALPGSLVQRALPRFVSFSTGTLLGAALLAMLPRAAEALPVATVAKLLLAGLILFFVLEKLLVWRHCHRHGCKVHAGAGPLLLLGDAFHNLVDGLVLAGAFLESTALGFATALSIIAHEVPQEVGEYLVYMRAGYSRRRALALNSLTALASVLGAVVGFSFLSLARGVVPFLLAFAAAGFLYVALADLIPAQREDKTRLPLMNLGFLAAGVAIVAWLS